MQRSMFVVVLLLSSPCTTLALSPSLSSSSLSTCFTTTGCIGLPRHCELTDECEILFTYSPINATHANLALVIPKSDNDEVQTDEKKEVTNVTMTLHEDNRLVVAHYLKTCVLIVAKNKSRERVAVFDVLETEESLKCVFNASFGITKKKGCINLKKERMDVQVARGLDMTTVEKVNLSRINVVVGMDDTSDFLTRAHAALMSIVYMALIPSVLLLNDVGRVYWSLLTVATLMTLTANVLLVPHLSFKHIISAILRLNKHAIFGILTSLLTSIYVLLRFSGHKESQYYVGHLAFLVGLGSLFTTGKLATAHFVPTEAFETLIIVFGSLSLLFMAVEANLRREMEEDEKNENVGSVRVAVMIVAGFFVWIVAGMTAVFLVMADEGKDEWFGDHVNYDDQDELFEDVANTIDFINVV